MTKFILKRLLLAIPVILFIIFVTLLLIDLAPGNYFSQLSLNPLVSQDVVKQYEEKFHMNDSIIRQYVAWFWGLLQGDFGFSFTYQQPVTKVIFSRMQATVLLSFAAFFVSWVIGIPLGMLAAFRKNSFIDKLICGFSYLCISIPGFFLALIALYLCAQYTTIPVGGMRSAQFFELSLIAKVGDVFTHMLIPVFVLASFAAAYLLRLVRAAVLDVLSAEYILVLRARGVPDLIVWKHVLRNILNPLITVFCLELPGLVSGAALIEIITGWPGLGSIMLYAVRSQDVFLIMGNMVMVSVVLVIGTILADILLALNDPRVRY